MTKYLVLIKKKTEKIFDKAIPVKEGTPISFLKIIRENAKKGFDIKIITKREFDRMIKV